MIDIDCSSPATTPVLDPYEALLVRLRQRLVPFTVFWELTHRCNLHCRMCYNVPRARPELSTEEALSLLPQLAEAGTLQLVLTGGELFTRPDFFTIAESARSLGFALHLKTNGTLITPTLADHIATLAPVRVDISLLGATPSTCATLTGFPQALTRIKRGVKLLRERDVRVHLYTLLMQSNLAEREQMIALARSLGISYEQVYSLSPDDDGQHRALAEQLNRSQIIALFDAESSPVPSALTARPCSVALSGCLISPYGIVYPCTELRIPAGDLRRQSFLTIWQEAPIFQQLRQVHTWQNMPDCYPCPLRNHCHGRCAGLAWKEQGDFLAGHTLACHQAQARFTHHHPHESLPLTPYLQRIRGANAL
ncbi:MAG: radical SAM protein [Chloroflexi bacterium]|nr:radical SAM protein [Chloroflexota bacterium]